MTADLLLCGLLLFAIAVARVALIVKDLLSTIILLSAFSCVMCLTYCTMGAIDVAFTEVAVGVGASTLYSLATLLRTTRRTD